jgi:hypothetical protein
MITQAVLTWLNRLRGSVHPPARPNQDDTHAPRLAPPLAVPAEYRLLYKYLNERYANVVVLTFREIEDLTGFSLPDPARIRKEWWANADANSGPSAQARAWTQAGRTAQANLVARTVAFERGSA